MQRRGGYRGCSAKKFIQESPNHGAATSGFAEVDLDHGTGFPALETLNQRFSGPTLSFLSPARSTTFE